MRLIEYLPRRHRSAAIGLFQEGAEPLMEAQQAAHDDFVAQLWPTTATWGLSTWEEALGLPTDVSRDMEFRRTRIVSKLRGSGPVTVEMIKNVAESFSNGEVEIIEHPAEYRFEVKFVGTIGIPPNMDDLTAALEEIKPAYLAYTYVIVYRTWGQVAEKTWGALEPVTWGDIVEGDIG